MSDQPIVIFRADNSQQAHLLRGLLEEQGIAAWVVNDSIQIAGGELPLGWRAAAQVVVAESDAIKARKFAKEFDQRASHAIALETEVEADADESWYDWPVCPECEERRQAKCTVCGDSRADFAVVDVLGETDRRPALMFCESCDDHFRPEFYRLCHRCGHDFGDGVSVNEVIRDPDQVNQSRRLWAFAAVMALATAALGAYFAYIMR